MSDMPPRQLYVVHEQIWAELEAWAARKNCFLAEIPSFGYDDGDGIPTYCLQPKLLR